MEKQRLFFQQYLIFVKKYYNTYPSIASELLEYRLVLRGLVTESTKNFKLLASQSKDTEVQKLYSDWVNAKEFYLKVLLKKEEDKRAYNLNELYEKLNLIEKSLQQKLNVNYKIEKVNWKTVQQNLQPNEAAIEIIKSITSEDTSYFYVIITPNQNQPELVIQNGSSIEDYVYTYYFRNVVDRKNVDKKSYQVLWKNIIDKSQSLKNYDLKKLYLVNDGIYHKIPIGTLFIPDENRFLADKIEIVYVLNLKYIKKAGYPIKNAVLMGYPDYKGSDLLPNNLPEEQFNIPNEQRSLMFRVLNFTNGIPMLPGTKAETDKIYEHLKKQQIPTQLYQDKQATEENFKKINHQATSIVHIATHGFFIEDEKKSNNLLVQQDEKYNLLYQNPLMRSGILLANCENDLNREKIYYNREDGILTAYEVSQMNLRNTELVVLSACQTGLGDLKNEEGVFGLQRAFILAGANSLIISLWSVDDAATQEFMINFYDAWLNKKMSKFQAFYAAQKQLRTKEEFQRPFYWGAFVLIGE